MFSSAAEPTTPTLYRYVITETGKFGSLDPLDADATGNLPVARMLYATPLETSEQNNITSRVLESFRYDSSQQTIEWVVKPGLKYEDGTSLTPDDVAFAVARMAYTRPKFPVLSAIEGIEQWSKTASGLRTYPTGIKIDGQKVSIQLTAPVEHPLFRFCLEVFAIIPRRCVDPATNKVSCKTIPESGPYRLVNQTPDTVLFKRREIESTRSLPKEIQFEYVAASELSGTLDKLDQRTVVAGSEANYSSATRRKLEEALQFQYLPASRFEVLIINKNVGPFSDPKCRQTFARTFRSVLKTLASDRVVEGSVFTKILPGYESLEEMDKAVKVYPNDLADCKTKFSKNVIPWALEEADRGSLFDQTIRATLEKLGAKPLIPNFVPTRKDLVKKFTGDEIAFYNSGSGFWALDPMGDVKMLFTPNLHKQFSQVTTDPKIQSLLDKLDASASSYKRVNEYLFQESLFNVYGHQRRFFATKNRSLIPELNFAITSPAPWQVFRAH